MSVTLSHQTALDVVRTLRAEGHNLHLMDSALPADPSPWVGRRFSMKNFSADKWRWAIPSENRPLHVLAAHQSARIRGARFRSHACELDLPPHSVIWLDEHASVVCPELLFLQMSDTFSLASLVMLGYELCGHFARSAHEPRNGFLTDSIPSATSVASIREFLSKVPNARWHARASKALDYVCDHAISAPEAVLATMYSLPTTDLGYGLGPVALNERVALDDSGSWTRNSARYPDLMFTLAPVGINYDGKDHLDLVGLANTAISAAIASTTKKSNGNEQAALQTKIEDVRSKVVDDIMRNRQLAAQGKIVFPAIKEDLYGDGRLDNLTLQILRCMRHVFGISTQDFEDALEDTAKQRDRQALIDSLLPFGGSVGTSWGKM